jgi:hypothetical protein
MKESDIRYTFSEKVLSLGVFFLLGIPVFLFMFFITQIFYSVAFDKNLTYIKKFNPKKMCVEKFPENPKMAEICIKERYFIKKEKEVKNDI